MEAMPDSVNLGNLVYLVDAANLIAMAASCSAQM